MKESPKLTPETSFLFHEFVPTGSISKPIVFSDPGNEVIENIKNTEQNRDSSYKYDIDKHQES